MITPVELALPCQVVRMELRVGPDEGATTLEDLVARAILARHDRADEPGSTGSRTPTRHLAWLFAVPEPVIVDVIGSLWAKGFVTVNFDDGTVELSPVGKELLSRGTSLAAAGDIQHHDFLFEPITGLIRPARHGDRRANKSAVELPLRHGFEVSDIPQADLVSGVQAALRHDEEKTGWRNVLQASFGNPMLRDQHDLTWLHVRVAAYRDPLSDQISITVDEALQWSPRAQETLQRYLRTLAEEEPDTPAIQHLQGHARPEPEPSQRLDDVLARMAEQIDGLERTELAQVPERQRVLRGLATRALDRLGEIRELGAVATMVLQPEGHEWAVSDLISAARTQLVLIAPTLEYQRVKALLPELRQALDRGVQLVLLWGRAAIDTLPERVSTLLHELYERRGAKVVWVPELSAQTDAAVIVQDDCRALVGSHGVLGTPAPGPKEASVLIEPSVAGPATPRAVQDILRWARTEFPRWALGQRIKLQADEFGGPAVVAPAANAVEREVLKIDATKVDEAGIPLWAASWSEMYADLVELRSQVVAKTNTVELLRDGEHRNALWQGLRRARRRLVVVDDRVDPRACNESVAQAVRDRRAAGVEVLLVHPELSSGKGTHQAFLDLRTGPHRVRVQLGRDRGRVIVADDEVALGSFSPLGDGRHGPGRRRTQLGVRVQDEQFAADFAAFLGAAPVAAPPPPALVGTRSGSSDLAASVLMKARATRSRREFGAIVVERLAGVESPWAVLDTWKDTQVPADDLRTAVAALLRATPERKSPSVQRWTRWLVEDAWARDAFVEAALLARRLPDRPGALDACADMAAALEIGPLGSIISNGAYALIDHPAPPRTAGAAGAFAEVLLHGGAEGYQALDLLGAELPSAWGDLVDQVLKLRTVPLPLAGLIADQTRLDSVRAVERRRAAVAVDIDKIEQLRGRFTFATGMLLHDCLFAPEGLLTAVRDAMRAGLQECIDLAPQLPVHVRAYLNQVIATGGGKPMIWHKQAHFLHSVAEIVRSAREVAVAAASGRLYDEDAMALPPDCADLAHHLVASWDALAHEAGGLGRPYSLPPLRLLNRLLVLEQWAREQQ